MPGRQSGGSGGKEFQREEIDYKQLEREMEVAVVGGGKGRGQKMSGTKEMSEMNVVVWGKGPQIWNYEHVCSCTAAGFCWS